METAQFKQLLRRNPRTQHGAHISAGKRHEGTKQLTGRHARLGPLPRERTIAALVRKACPDTGLRKLCAEVRMPFHQRSAAQIAASVNATILTIRRAAEGTAHIHRGTIPIVGYAEFHAREKTPCAGGVHGGHRRTATIDIIVRIL